jgi:hypothetical protein
MGLDCTAYSDITRVPDKEHDADGVPIDDRVQADVHPHFTEQALGLINGAVYSYADAMGFRAGSYGSYNQWRRELAGIAGYTPEALWEGQVPDDVPFASLVNFSDCEGVIGPVVSKRLLTEFETFDSIASEQMSSYDYEKYKTWTKAFRMAANNGFVDFH